MVWQEGESGLFCPQEGVSDEMARDNVIAILSLLLDAPCLVLWYYTHYMLTIRAYGGLVCTSGLLRH